MPAGGPRRKRSGCAAQSASRSRRQNRSSRTVRGSALARGGSDRAPTPGRSSGPSRFQRSYLPRVQFLAATSLRITLNGEPFELDQPVSVDELLRRLEIDPRRVAVEHNLTILKRFAFTTTLVGEG